MKLSTAIISVSSIRLLLTFINDSRLPEQTMKWQFLIDLGLLISTAAIAPTDRLLTSTLQHQPH
ncbi:hypothetical protein [Crenobacter oryzisoli]|uniref:hypothetical protein n=1 Tax=Crenobacter oryzisoli TaxID=3056844 RepID=UPI00320468CC